MTRRVYTVEKGLRITGENSDVGVAVLFGSTAPGGDAGDQDSAEQGSYYLRTNGESFQKTTAGTGTDKWTRTATVDDITSIKWRPEVVRAATGDADPGASKDLATPFGDDDTPFLTGSDFAIGEHIIFGVGGTPVLKEITNIVGDVLTLAAAASPLSDNDMLIVRNYLPDDGDSQEKQAIVLYNGANIIKISDFNWDVATGINISAGYTPGSGDPNTNDSVESAIQKVDGNNDAQDTLIGTAQGATNLGTFAGDIISDNGTIKAGMGELEAEIELNESRKSQNAVTTAVVLDELSVDEYLSCDWEVVAVLDSAPANRQAYMVAGMHDGHTGADAANTDETVFAKRKLGTMANPTITVVLNGLTGAAQTVQLKVANSVATSFRSTRLGFTKADGI